MKTLKNSIAVMLVTAMTLSAVTSATAADTTPQLININTAGAAELETLPGIGPSKSRAIIDYREKRPFGKIEDIMRVKGIGRKSFLKLKPFLSVSGESRPAPKAPSAQH